MRHIIFICALFTLSSAKAGYIEYYKFINEGEYHMYEGHYHLAISNFETAFALVTKPKARDYYLASKCYAQLQDEKMMYVYLQLAIENNLEKPFIEVDSLWFSNYRFNSEFKDILNLKPIPDNLVVDEKAEADFKALRHLYDLKKVIKFYKYYNNKDTTSKDYHQFMKKYIPYRDSFSNALITYCIHLKAMPTDLKAQRMLTTYCILFFNKEIEELNDIKSQFIALVDSGQMLPITFAEIFDRIPENRNDHIRAIKSTYGIQEESIAQTDWEIIMKNRSQIGLSPYYYNAPNYFRNYKPDPIINALQPVDSNTIPIRIIK